MALTYQTYTGNGSLTTFPISFDWVASTDVLVTVDGSTKINGTDYTIVNKNVVFTVAPSSGVAVKVARSSNLTSRNVDFVNGSRLDETDLDNSAKQLFNLIQELWDKVTDAAAQVVNAATALLVDGSVTNAKLADNAVTASKVSAGAITPTKLSTGGPSWDANGNISAAGASPTIVSAPSAASGIGSFISAATNASNVVAGQLQMYSSLVAGVINQVFSLPLVLMTNNTEKMRISADGNVGIGTSSPSAKLEVAGAIKSTSPAFGAYQSTAQSIAATTYTKINLQTEEYDTNSCFDTATSRFTPTVAGYYQINGSFVVATSSSAGTASIYKNGAIHKQGHNAVSSGYLVSSLVYLNGTTDYVELFAYITTAQNTLAGDMRTYFNAVLAKAA